MNVLGAQLSLLADILVYIKRLGWPILSGQFAILWPSLDFIKFYD